MNKRGNRNNRKAKTTGPNLSKENRQEVEKDQLLSQQMPPYIEDEDATRLGVQTRKGVLAQQK